MKYLNIIGFIIIIAMFATLNAYSQERTDEKPNIILILADDLGYADLSLTGSTQIPTPNIDLLAKEGVFFDQGYVSAPVCSPSRAGLITGKNQVTFGYDNNMGTVVPGFDPEYMGLPTHIKTIPERLKELGYISGLIGKWHLGVEEKYHPLNRGFDEFWGYTGGGHDYFKSDPNGKGSLSPLESNYKDPQKISYLTDDKGDECVEFIQRHKEDPFFLFASFNAPHGPLQAKEKDLEKFSHIKDEGRRTYCAMVYRLDLNVGRIMATLKEEGLEENTLVVFLSDNGGPVDQNNAINAPLNGQKGILLEGGMRVPFIMKWPGKFPKGTVYKQPVISLDLAPTFVSAAGGRIPESEKVDGVDLTPFLSLDTKEKPHESMKWKFTISAAYREGDWKLVRLPDRLPMLYNLSKDISEQNNVAMENPNRTKAMLKKLGEWDVKLPHPLFLEGAEWKRNQLKLYDDEYQIVQP